MKVFFVNAVCGTGSTGRIVTDLLHTASAEGFELILVNFLLTVVLSCIFIFLAQITRHGSFLLFAKKN